MNRCCVSDLTRELHSFGPNQELKMFIGGKIHPLNSIRVIPDAFSPDLTEVRKDAVLFPIFDLNKITEEIVDQSPPVGPKEKYRITIIGPSSVGVKTFPTWVREGFLCACAESCSHKSTKINFDGLIIEFRTLETYPEYDNDSDIATVCDGADLILIFSHWKLGTGMSESERNDLRKLREKVEKINKDVKIIATDSLHAIAIIEREITALI